MDGKCVAANSDTKCTSNSAGACSSCAQGYFLHRGGCYAIEGAVGLLICDDKTATAGKDGICVTCHEGYFKNPASATDKTKESCIACNQTAAIDRYQGVDKCAACDSSQLPSSGGGTAKCTKCQGTDYLKSDGTACGEKTSTCVSDTEFAKEDAANGNKCASCGDAVSVAECATCNEGFNLDTGKNCVSSGNTNKGGLSTGAIAGISVAAVVVVGGLVGFLCWWFVCRGKA